MGRQTPSLYRSRRSFRSLYCLVLAISAALLWQSWRAYAKNPDLSSIGEAQHLQHRAQHASNVEILRADYLPWEGSTGDHLYRGHRSHRHLDSQPVERKSEASSIATTQHVSYNDNGVPVEQLEGIQAPLQVAVTSASNLVSETPSSPDTAATAASDVFADEPLATVAHTAVVSTEGYRFSDRQACDSVVELADTLPDLIFVPFDDAVSDMVLQGWEDDWISTARYSGPKLEEPKIDFVYNWVNGSQSELVQTMRPYELDSSLNDEDGVWLSSHGSNRYREWDELRYSVRSIEKYAGTFLNRIQMLVNAVELPANAERSRTEMSKQCPNWLKEDSNKVQVLSQEEFFGPEERKCLPSFDSLTIENQLYNTRSDTDRLFALSDDMILGKVHAASDLFSPLFGHTFGFKDNAYNTLQPPTEKDAERFGEKPFLIYTSWLLNRRFGARKRKGQVHFGHSLSRTVTREALTSFPRPALRSASQRFRGETGFQLYSWFAIFHYTIERHREALLWSYIMLRSDKDDDGYLSWSERMTILRDLEEGMSNDHEVYRDRQYYRVGDRLTEAGLEAPKVNTEILWTSMDGPVTIKDLECEAFDTEECLAPGFSMASSDAQSRSPVFGSAVVFDRVARQLPRCGDCLLKLVLNRRRAGLGPVLPHPTKKSQQRDTVVKALMRFQYTVVQPDASFYMVTDAEQARHVLLKPYIKHGKTSGQMCLNDDVLTEDENELAALKEVMKQLFEGLLPEPSSFEM